MMETNTELNKTAESLVLQKLQVFVGTWHTSGRTVEGKILEATDTYEWLTGGYFLIHKWNACLEKDRVEGIEIIGYEPESGKYSTRSFDSLGNSGRYTAELNGTIWQINGETEQFTGEFNPEKNCLTGRWEVYNGLEWKPWMEITLTKNN